MLWRKLEAPQCVCVQVDGGVRNFSALPQIWAVGKDFNRAN